MLLSNQRVKEELRREVEKHRETRKDGNMAWKCAAPKAAVDHRQERRHRATQPSLAPQGARKGRTKSQISRRKEIINKDQRRNQ